MTFIAVAVTVLMLAQPVSAAALTSVVTDPTGDTLSTGFSVPPYLDIILTAITLKNGQFTFRMELAAPIPETPGLPPGFLPVTWLWGLNTDPATFPVGFPFAPGQGLPGPNEFIVWVLWDGTSFTGTVVDRRPLLTGGEAVITSGQAFRIDGAKVTLFVDAALLDNPSSFSFASRTRAWMGAFGSIGHVDLDTAPDFPGSAPWPA